MPRTRGEGAVYELGGKGSGRWVGEISWTDGTGKRHRRRVRAKTARAAAAQLAILEREREGQRARRRTTARTRVTLGYHLEQWLETVVVPSRRPKTARVYTYQVRRYIAPAIGHIALADLGPRDIQRLLNGMRQQGLSASTVDQCRRVLSAALHAAETWGDLDDLPLRGVVKPRGPRREPVVLTVPQIRALLEAAEALVLRSADKRRQSPWLHAMIAIAATVGARQGEVLGLRWRDVELETGVLHIRGQLQRGEHVEVKTNDTRAVVLPGIARRALVQWAARQAQDAAKAGNVWQDTGYVFTTQHGTPLPARFVLRAYKALSASAGMPAALTFHDLRHTAATQMALAGAPKMAAMAVTGHRRGATLEEIYQHASAEIVRSVADLIDARLDGS